eukprot:2841405-Amphidinium_carterae.1
MSSEVQPSATALAASSICNGFVGHSWVMRMPTWMLGSRLKVRPAGIARDGKTAPSERKLVREIVEGLRPRTLAV